MRSRRPGPEHQEALSRRLALLSAELAVARDEPTGGRLDAADPLVSVPARAADGTEWWSAHTRVPDRPRLAVVTGGPAGSDAPDGLGCNDQPENPDDLTTHDGLEILPRQAPDVPAPAAARLPVPGRHASRRVRRSLWTAWPDTLRGQVGFAQGQLAVVAVLIAVGLAVTAWWVVRGQASPVAPPVTASSGEPLVQVSSAPPVPVAPPPNDSAGTESAVPVDAGGDVTVDVTGRVRRPGIAVLDSGARVVDALEAAGGARDGVDLSGLNLARVLVDGEQILVGLAAPTGSAAVAPAPVPGAPAPTGVLVNLNTATEAELDTLPEVGPVTAASILAWRDEHGGFTSVDELLEVDGIGETTLSRIAPYVSV